jgi:hypothetical protein
LFYLIEELLATASFEKNPPFAQHEHAHFVALFNPHICQSHGIKDALSVIGGDNEQDLHGRFYLVNFRDG